MECSCSIDPADCENYWAWDRAFTEQFDTPVTCSECNQAIEPGKNVKVFIGIPNDKCDEVFRNNTCSDCLSLYEAYFCSRIFGELWETFEEEVSEQGPDAFLDSRLAKLTPVARAMACAILEEYICEKCGAALDYSGGESGDSKHPLCADCLEEIENA